MKTKKKTIQMTSKQLDLIGLSILAKIRKDRDALEEIICEKARIALADEISDLNAILVELTKV